MLQIVSVVNTISHCRSLGFWQYNTWLRIVEKFVC